MTIFNELPRLDEEGKAVDEDSRSWQVNYWAMGQVGRHIGNPNLSEDALEIINELSVVQPELATELARYVEENASTAEEQEIALKTSVMALRRVAAQLQVSNRDGIRVDVPEFHIETD